MSERNNFISYLEVLFNSQIPYQAVGSLASDFRRLGANYCRVFAMFPGPLRKEQNWFNFWPHTLAPYRLQGGQYDLRKIDRRWKNRLKKLHSIFAQQEIELCLTILDMAYFKGAINKTLHPWLREGNQDRLAILGRPGRMTEETLRIADAAKSAGVKTLEVVNEPDGGLLLEPQVAHRWFTDVHTQLRSRGFRVIGSCKNPKSRYCWTAMDQCDFFSIHGADLNNSAPILHALANRVEDGVLKIASNDGARDVVPSEVFYRKWKSVYSTDKIDGDELIVHKFYQNNPQLLQAANHRQVHKIAKRAIHRLKPKQDGKP